MPPSASPLPCFATTRHRARVWQRKPHRTLETAAQRFVHTAASSGYICRYDIGRMRHFYYNFYHCKYNYAAQSCLVQPHGACILALLRSRSNIGLRQQNFVPPYIPHHTFLGRRPSNHDVAIGVPPAELPKLVSVSTTGVPDKAEGGVSPSVRGCIMYNNLQTWYGMVWS